jgi:putative sugar O-methyltransferase
MTPELEALDDMLDEVLEAGGVLAPSAFWTDFARRNIATLRGDGLDGFKRSINHNYFQFVINSPRQPEFRTVLRRWLTRPVGAPWGARFGDDDVDWLRGDRAGEAPESRRAKGYALYVALLWELARRHAGAETADQLSEPPLGRPIAVRHRGTVVSQDLANSLLELAAIRAVVPRERLDTALVLEIGGGYGRFADLLLTLHPRGRLVMIDIPPALAVSQYYLTHRHPARSVWRFRRGIQPGDATAIADHDLVFLTPNQFASLDPIGADLAINISSLHEMRPVQIAEYLRLIGLHAAGGWLYTKQWRRWHNPIDDVTIEREGYPYPPGSERCFDRIAPAQPRFFEALLKLL